MFPPWVCDRLSLLQTNTSPHPWSQTHWVLLDQLGPHYTEMFSSFDRQTVGSGCCAQVYRATMEGVGEVAVKVVHPSMASMLKLDLILMKAVARLTTWLVPSFSWLSFESALEEFEQLMIGQVDMRDEADNLGRFRKNFKDHKGISFPRPLVVREEVLIETWAEGFPIGRYLSGEIGNEEERVRLADLGVEMLLKMVFIDNFWHGDLHPGNLMVSGGRGDDLQLVVLDPGIAASLSQRDRYNLVDVFKAVVKGDGEKVGQLFLDRSYHECEDNETFVQEIGDLVMKVRKEQLSLDRVDVSALLQSVFSTLARHKVRLDPCFSSVVIAIAIVEGVGRSLDSQLDLISRALPYLIQSRS